MMASISPQAEPFLLTGTADTACLFIHGFTASPSEVYPVARLIYDETQYTVSGPLLPGHGCTPLEMNRTGWKDWFARIEQEIDFLQRRSRRVFVAGLSMGGLLSLHAAKSYENLNGVIAINTPIFTKADRLMMVTRLLRYIRPYHPKRMDRHMAELEKKGRFAYSVMPLKALHSMHALRDIIIEELPALRIPILLFQSRQDETVDPRSAHFIKERAGYAPVKLIELQNSRHVATMGPENQLIAQEIIEFMKEPRS